MAAEDVVFIYPFDDTLLQSGKVNQYPRRDVIGFSYPGDAPSGSGQVYWMTSPVSGGGTTSWTVVGEADFAGTQHPSISQGDLLSITLIN